MGKVVKLKEAQNAGQFKRGRSKTGGRKRGGRNQVTERMREAMEANGLELVENMLGLALGANEDQVRLADLLQKNRHHIAYSEADHKVITQLIFKLLSADPALQFAATRWCLEKLMGKPAQPLRVQGSVTERKVWLSQLPAPRQVK